MKPIEPAAPVATDLTTIQWYPGHMAKAMRRLREDIRLVDVVIEVVDARVPVSGRNPNLARMIGTKRSILVYGRDDLADPETTQRFVDAARAGGVNALAVSGKSTGSLRALHAALKEMLDAKKISRGLILGIPNGGKSTIINGLAKRNVARTEDRAGVTRAAQWFRLLPTFEVMDTAGILAPRIDTAEAKWRLALVGAVPRARFDAEEVVARFHTWASDVLGRASIPDLDTFAKSRGFVRRGTVVDAHNASWAYIKDFNDGKFGRLTLDAAP